MYELPKSLEVGGEYWDIRTDFRDILNVIAAMNDPDLEDAEKAFVTLYVIYEDFEEMPKELYNEAFQKANDFIGRGGKKGNNRTKLIDFEQDEHLLMGAVNRVAGCEVREKEYLHWWTFMGYFMEIGECTYSTVLNIRSKRAKGKTLEKWEREYYENNKEIVNIQERLSTEEIEAMRRLEEMIG